MFIGSEEAGDIWQKGKNNEVHVWSTPKTRNSIDAVSKLLLDAPDGTRVRLSDVAEVKIVADAERGRAARTTRAAST